MSKPLLALLFLLSTLALAPQSARADEAKGARVDAGESARLAADVKAEFLHAWQGYRRYAWGHDDLAPLSRKPYDWYGDSLLMTPVDALDTLVLMGFTKDADDVRELIATK